MALLIIPVGPLHDPVTWYKIKYTGEQVAHWDFQNNAPAFVLEVSLRNLLTSICSFVPCDRVVQWAYWSEVNHLAIYKCDRVFELGATEKQIQEVVRAGLEPWPAR